MASDGRFIGRSAGCRFGDRCGCPDRSRRARGNRPCPCLLRPRHGAAACLCGRHWPRESRRRNGRINIKVIQLVDRPSIRPRLVPLERHLDSGHVAVILEIDLRWHPGPPATGTSSGPARRRAARSPHSEIQFDRRAAGFLPLDDARLTIADHGHGPDDPIRQHLPDLPWERQFRFEASAQIPACQRDDGNRLGLDRRRLPGGPSVIGGGIAVTA